MRKSKIIINNITAHIWRAPVKNVLSNFFGKFSWKSCFFGPKRDALAQILNGSCKGPTIRLTDEI